MPFDVWDISTWVVMSQEARGLDPKDWVVSGAEVTAEGPGALVSVQAGQGRWLP